MSLSWNESCLCFFFLWTVYLFFKVCLEKLNDIQLALVIARLYESEFDKSATYKSVLQKKVLGIDSPVHKLSSLSINMHCDPFLRSMAHWILEDYGSALETLIKQPAREDDGKLHLSCQWGRGLVVLHRCADPCSVLRVILNKWNLWASWVCGLVVDTG